MNKPIAVSILQDAELIETVRQDEGRPTLRLTEDGLGFSRIVGRHALGRVLDWSRLRTVRKRR